MLGRPTHARAGLEPPVPGRLVNIAFAFLSMPVGGAEDFAVDMARLLPADCAVSFLCLRTLGRIGEELRDAGAPVHLVRAAPGRRLNLVGMARLARWLRAQDIDVVHTQTYHAHLCAIPAARLAGVRTVLHQQKTHRPTRTHRMLAMRWLTRRADRVLALSDRTRADLIEAYRIVPERVLVVPNGIDLAEFTPADDRQALRRALGLDPARYLIGAVASLASVKNHAMTLRMLAGLRARGTDFRAIFLGEGAGRPALEEEIRRLDLGEHVRLAGAVRPVAPWMRSLDLAVLPSQWEGQPLCLLQAMACGVPVLASRIEGNVAVLGEDHPGLFNLDDPDAYQEMAARMIAGGNPRARILAHQSARLRQWPDAAAIAGRLAAIYREITRR